MNLKTVSKCQLIISRVSANGLDLCKSKNGLHFEVINLYSILILNPSHFRPVFLYTLYQNSQHSASTWYPLTQCSEKVFVCIKLFVSLFVYLLLWLFVLNLSVYFFPFVYVFILCSPLCIFVTSV